MSKLSHKERERVHGSPFKRVFIPLFSASGEGGATAGVLTHKQDVWLSIGSIPSKVAFFTGVSLHYTFNNYTVGSSLDLGRWGGPIESVNSKQNRLHCIVSLFKK